MVEGSILAFVAICIACFSIGFSFCQLLHLFFD